MTSPQRIMANEAIDAITLAMSRMNVLTIASDDSLHHAVLEHLVQSRKLLIAKYQPNAEEIGR